MALNEASFLEVDVSSIDEGLAVLTLRVLSWDDKAGEPTNTVVNLALSGVSRLAASLRSGTWNDEDAPVRRMSIEDVSENIRALGASDLYGWEYRRRPGLSSQLTRSSTRGSTRSDRTARC